MSKKLVVPIRRTKASGKHRAPSVNSQKAVAKRLPCIGEPLTIFHGRGKLKRLRRTGTKC